MFTSLILNLSVQFAAIPNESRSPECSDLGVSNPHLLAHVDNESCSEGDHSSDLGPPSATGRPSLRSQLSMEETEAPGEPNVSLSYHTMTL